MLAHGGFFVNYMLAYPQCAGELLYLGACAQCALPPADFREQRNPPTQYQTSACFGTRQYLNMPTRHIYLSQDTLPSPFPIGSLSQHYYSYGVDGIHPDIDWSLASILHLTQPHDCEYPSEVDTWQANAVRFEAQG